MNKKDLKKELIDNNFFWFFLFKYSNNKKELQLKISRLREYSMTYMNSQHFLFFLEDIRQGLSSKQGIYLWMRNLELGLLKESFYLMLSSKNIEDAIKKFCLHDDKISFFSNRLTVKKTHTMLRIQYICFQNPSMAEKELAKGLLENICCFLNPYITYLHCYEEQENIICDVSRGCAEKTLSTTNSEMQSWLLQKINRPIKSINRKQSIVELLSRHVTEDVSWLLKDMKTIAFSWDISVSSLKRKFSIENNSFSRFSDSAKCYYINRWLFEDKKTEDIAFEVGFKSREALEKFYKRKYAITPANIRDVIENFEKNHGVDDSYFFLYDVPADPFLIGKISNLLCECKKLDDSIIPFIQAEWVTELKLVGEVFIKKFGMSLEFEFAEAIKTQVGYERVMRILSCYKINFNARVLSFLRDKEIVTFQKEVSIISKNILNKKISQFPPEIYQSFNELTEVQIKKVRWCFLLLVCAALLLRRTHPKSCHNSLLVLDDIRQCYVNSHISVVNSAVLLALRWGFPSEMVLILTSLLKKMDKTKDFRMPFLIEAFYKMAIFNTNNALKNISEKHKQKNIYLIKTP
ncbi:MAG: hypothetical protein AAGB12_09605 [Pseudomonadota bacterium]